MTTPAEYDALWLCKRLIEEFPGLMPEDIETDISGADLVEWLCYQLAELEALTQWLDSEGVE